MNPIQEVVVLTDKGARLTLHIVGNFSPEIDSQSGDRQTFRAEYLLFDQAGTTPHHHWLARIDGIFNTALLAFETLIVHVKKYCTTTGQKVVGIDNPCNCEFVSKADQQRVAATNGLEAEVTVNARYA